MFIILLDVHVPSFSSFSEDIIAEKWRVYLSALFQFMSLLKIVSPEESLLLMPYHASQANWIRMDDAEPLSFDQYCEFLNTPIQSDTDSFSEASNVSGPLFKTLCLLNKYKTEEKNSDHRVLVVSISQDNTKHFIPLMKAAFAAVKLNVRIDSCSILVDSFHLTQISHITKGSYLKIPAVEELAYYLNTNFLPQHHLRETLFTYITERSENKLPCFCHSIYQSQGYLCSLCMAFYCDFVTECSSCKQLKR